MSLCHLLWRKVSFAATAKSTDNQPNPRIMEGDMSLCVCENVTNNHESDVLDRLGDRFQVWFRRWHQRDELTHWSERDLHDVGLSWSDVVREAEKPFWRA
jgi:uncharacterized protein YjiS (DUF1127 family)